jgi:hypothetical protein
MYTSAVQKEAVLFSQYLIGEAPNKSVIDLYTRAIDVKKIKLTKKEVKLND